MANSARARSLLKLCLALCWAGCSEPIYTDCPADEACASDADGGTMQLDGGHEELGGDGDEGGDGDTHVPMSPRDASADGEVDPPDTQMPADAQVPPDATPPLCLVDGDRDGFGVLMVCPPEGEEPGLEPKDCDDDDKNAYPGAPIVRCDGVDNDCDGKDEQKVDEICNGADDDCAGRVDFGLVAPASARVITRPGSATAAVDVSLVSREDGGGWLLSLPNADPNSSESIVYRGLSPNGALSSDAGQRGTLADNARKFVADSDGKWLAVLSARRPRADDWLLQLQLFRAGDLTLASQVNVVTHGDDDGAFNDRNDSDDCDGVVPLDVALFTDVDGRVWVAMQFTDQLGQMAQSTCTSTSTQMMQVAEFNAEGMAPALHKSSTLSSPLAGRLAKIPCRPEWLVIDGDTPQRFAIKGTPLGDPLDKIQGASKIWSLAAAPERCDSAQNQMAVVYMRAQTLGYSPGLVRQFKVDAADGSISRLGNDIELEGDMSEGAAAAFRQGRWFVAGWFNYPNYAPRLWEVATSDAVVPFREIVLPGSGPLPGYAVGNAAVLSTRDGLVVGYQNANGGSLANFRDQGDTDPPIAVLYSLACAP